MENSQNKLRLFENKKIRYVWNADEEEWYFSVVDIVEVLADSKDYQTARKYWNKLKQRLNEEGSQLVTNCHQLKLLAPDGKMRETDTLSTKNVLRLIQSIPSPKAEPFKMWLAQVGNDRLEEYADPEKAITHCPQSIPIREKIKQADKALRPLPYKIGISVARKFMLKKI